MRKKDEEKAEKEYEKMPYLRLFSHREEIADVRCKKKLKKILLLCGASQTVLNFRVGLIQALKDAGWNVSVAVLDSKYKEEIRALPIDRLFCAEQSNRSLNPFALLRLKGYYQKIIGKIRPDVVMTFMLKPNTLGVAAAH